MEKLVLVVVAAAAVVVAAVLAVLADFAVKTLHYLNCHCDFPCVLLSSFLLMAHFVC